ncbi:MAG: hypothetical protein RLZZ312_1502 [Bacteroidota bacterium]
MKKFLFLTVISIFISCKKTSTVDDILKTKAGDSTDKIESESPLKIDTAKIVLPAKRTECFVFAKNKDTTAVELTFDRNKINGKMHWNPFEKDGAVGTLDGSLENDTIVAVYSYMIEGNNQKEEKVFVYNNNNLIELSGPLKETRGIMSTTNKKTATSKIVLLKIANGAYKFPNLLKKRF